MEEFKLFREKAQEFFALKCKVHGGFVKAPTNANL
jgi:hypothetical protein